MLRRILIADDSATVRRILRQYLEQQDGIEVCGEATNGLEAIEQAFAQRPDLVILDAVMPELNGFEASALIKSRLPETKTILFSMYADELRRFGDITRIDVILAKPEGVASVVAVIDGLLPKDTHRDAGGTREAPFGAAEEPITNG